jgi:hypothetical protein
MNSAAGFWALFAGLIGIGVTAISFLYLHLQKKWREQHKDSDDAIN